MRLTKTHARRRIWIYAISLVMLILVGACKKAPYVLYEIPEGYVGWVSVEYDDEECPTKETPLGYRVRISQQGLGCTVFADTSTKFVKYTYVDSQGDATTKLEDTGWGEGGMIWGEHNGHKGELLFFVGPEEGLKDTETHPWGKVKEKIVPPPLEGSSSSSN